MGAMTLNVSYAKDLVELVDVTVPDNDNMLYTVDNGNIRIAWASTNPLVLNPEDVVVTLRFKTLGEIASADQLVTLSGGSEFADEYAGILSGVTLKTTGIETSTGSAGYALSTNYPNPFTKYTDIEYTIPEPGQVKVNVYDILGNMIITLEDGNMEAGSHKVRFFVNGNNPGVYFYELKVQGEKSNYIFRRKMVIK